MSISCVKIEDPKLTEKEALHIEQYVHANVDSAIQNQFPFPGDYKFAPCFLPKPYEKFANRIRDFKVRSDDIWILTYPKSGTTWVSNIVWQLQNKLDFSARAHASANNMYLEGPVLYWSDNVAHKNGAKSVETIMESMESAPSPRLIRSHLPAHLLPKDIWTVKPKLIYMHRDPRDVAISYGHMYNSFKYIDFRGTMEEFYDIFLKGYVCYGPFWKHVNGFRKLDKLEHILFMSYEEMVANSFDGVKKISEFLGCSYTDEQLEQLTKHVSFDKMRKTFKDERKRFSDDYNFFRKGKSGGYRDEMSLEYIQRFDEWEKEHQD